MTKACHSAKCQPVPEVTGPRMEKAVKRKYESPRQLARQASILEATRQMLAEVGYNGMTMRNLAERAGVVPGTLYNLYKSKDELILAALEDLLDGIGDSLLRKSEPGIDRLLRFYDFLAQSLDRQPAYAEAMGRALYRSVEGDPLVEILYGRVVRYVQSELGVAQRNGQIKADVDLEIFAKHCTAAGWAVVMAAAMGVFSEEQVSGEYLRAHYMVLIPILNDEWRARVLAVSESTDVAVL